MITANRLRAVRIGEGNAKTCQHAQWIEQSGGEPAPAVSKTGTNAAEVPVCRLIAAIGVDLLCCPQSLRSTRSVQSPTHIRADRRQAIVEWSAVTLLVA
jgi:hypothetical protein